MRKHTLCFLFSLILTRYQLASSIESRPFPFTEQQPDGSKITLMADGDEVYSALRDMDGYLVLKNEKGEYVYAEERSDGLAHPSEDLVGRKTASGRRARRTRKELREKNDCFKQRCGPVPQIKPEHLPNSRGQSRNDEGNREFGDTSRRLHGRRAAATTGRLKNLVVLLYFKDHAASKRKIPSEDDINILMNADEPDPVLCPTGSLKSAYMEMSYGQLEIDSFVASWYVTSETESFYADGRSGTTNLHDAMREALDYLDTNKIINFTDFDEDGDGFIDSITFIHSGYGAEWNRKDCDGQARENRIWSHEWELWGNSRGENVGPWISSDGKVRVFAYHISPALWGTCGSEIGRMGVIAHETGHFLGIPDLYDTNGGGRGLGGYCMMSSSWGFDFQQRYPGMPSAWTRLELGWDFPQTPVFGTNYVVNANEKSDQAQIYMIGEEFGFKPGEYLLIENRQRKGLDSLLPGTGLAIYHIDEAAGLSNQGYPGQYQWPKNGLHYRVALLQADGLFNLEKGENRGGTRDFYHAGTIGELMPSNNPLQGPFPNTDSYQSGDVYQTGVEIYGISETGDTMTFEFYHPSAPTPPPSSTPSYAPTSQPSVSLVPSTSAIPSDLPSLLPTLLPSKSPSSQPSKSPSSQPSVIPSISITPSGLPSFLPSDVPSRNPSSLPSIRPSPSPTSLPSISHQPSSSPSVIPSDAPSLVPSSLTTISPSRITVPTPTSGDAKALNQTSVPTQLLAETPIASPTEVPAAATINI